MNFFQKPLDTDEARMGIIIHASWSLCVKELRGSPDAPGDSLCCGGVVLP